MAEAGFVKVAETGELTPGKMRAVRLGEEEVMLVNVDGNYYAISDTCSHRGGTLSEGDLDGEQIECPLHGATSTWFPARRLVYRRARAFRLTK